MAPQPTVGLVGSRTVDTGLQSSDKKTVTEFAFPANSRTPNQIGLPHEGAMPNKNPTKLGDCYKDSVEDTNLCARRSFRTLNSLSQRLSFSCPNARPRPSDHWPLPDMPVPSVPPPLAPCLFSLCAASRSSSSP